MKQPSLNSAADGRYALLALLLAVALGLWAARHVGDVGPPDDGRLAQPRDLPAFQLRRVDDGRVFDRDALRGRWTLLYSGYRSCPDRCPTTLARLTHILAQLEPPLARRLQTVFLSIDPARDDGAPLAAYTAHFSPSMIPVTGDITQLERVTRALGMLAPPALGATDRPAHSSVVALIGPDARLHRMLRYAQSDDALLASLRSALFGSPRGIRP